MDVQSTVFNMLSYNLDVDRDKITLDSELVNDLGADSLDSIELTMALEDELGIEISDTEIEGVKTVGQLLAIAEDKISKKA